MRKKQAEKQAKGGRGIINDKMRAAQWREGVSGNYRGRPLGGWSWVELIREYGDKECPAQFVKGVGFKENPTWKEVVIAMAFRHAAKGNASILKTLVEYVDGRPPIEGSSFADVAERLKREAEEQGIDWRKNPGLVMLISAVESFELKHGEA